MMSAAVPGNALGSRPSRRLRTKRASGSSRSAARRRAPGSTKSAGPDPEIIHASKILRNLLEGSTDKSFTVEKIVQSLGGNSAFGMSLLTFSIPEVLPIPVPGISALVAVPTGIIAAQMAAGKEQLVLPKFLLKRKIPRKALATAIRAIMPFLEKAERYVKPRWQWAVHPVSKRFIGVFILILALVIAIPVPGTNMPPAIAIFLISLGLIEKDGKLIALGILVGIAAIALIGGVFFGILSLLGLV
jgi:hypothetical protein